jgi:hypothetical protein
VSNASPASAPAGRSGAGSGRTTRATIARAPLVTASVNVVRLPACTIAGTNVVLPIKLSPMSSTGAVGFAAIGMACRANVSVAVPGSNAMAMCCGPLASAKSAL